MVRSCVVLMEEPSNWSIQILFIDYCLFVKNFVGIELSGNLKIQEHLYPVVVIGHLNQALLISGKSGNKCAWHWPNVR